MLIDFEISYINILYTIGFYSQVNIHLDVW